MVRCILLNLRARTLQRALLPLLTYFFYCRSRGIANFTLPFTTNEMISISTSQSFRSWVVMFHLRRPMAFVSLSLYDTPLGISWYECFILRARRLSSKLLKQGYLVERLKSSFRKFWGRYGDLIEQYEVSLSRMLNEILTLDQFHWLPYRSDFPPIVMTLILGLTFTELRVVSMEHFQLVLLASRERLPFRTPEFAYAQIVETSFTEHLEYPSILSRFCLSMLH